MQQNFDLFGEPLPATATQENPSSLMHLKVQTKSKATTPAQRRFNKLLSRIENLTRYLQTLEDRMQRLQGPHLQRMDALNQQAGLSEKAMVRRLHQHLQRKGLTAGQKRWVLELIESLLMKHQTDDDTEWKTLFDTYHTPEKLNAWERQEQQDMQALRAELEAMTGTPIEGLDNAQNPEELMALLMAHMHTQQQQEQAEQLVRRSKRKPSARQQQALQQQQDAQGTLRQMYRQLASALHPDRETDPAERQRKTALMSEANAAYERRDLSALLRLQLQAAQVDPQALARMTDEKLTGLNGLLQEQVNTLERELREGEDRIGYTLGFPVSATSFETVWITSMQRRQQDMSDSVAQMEIDVVRIEDDAQFLLWVKEQIAYDKQLDRQQKQFAKFMGNDPFDPFY
jgi:hypothetical protein